MLRIFLIVVFIGLVTTSLGFQGQVQILNKGINLNPPHGLCLDWGEKTTLGGFFPHHAAMGYNACKDNKPGYLFRWNQDNSHRLEIWTDDLKDKYLACLYVIESPKHPYGLHFGTIEDCTAAGERGQWKIGNSDSDTKGAIRPLNGKNSTVCLATEPSSQIQVGIVGNCDPEKNPNHFMEFIVKKEF